MMKTILTAFALIAFAQAAVVPKNVPEDKEIDDLIKRAVARLADYYAKQHLTVPEFGSFPMHSEDDKTNAQLTLTNVKVVPSGFKVDEVHSTRTASHVVAQARLFMDESFSGDVEINGVVKGQKVDQKGTFSATFQGITTEIAVTLKYDQKSVVIEGIAVSFSINLPKAEVEGIKMEGVPQEVVNEHLGITLYNFALDVSEKQQENMPATIEAFNKQMEGKTLDEVLEWIKKVIE